jgi:hypothetical protein
VRPGRSVTPGGKEEDVHSHQRTHPCAQREHNEIAEQLLSLVAQRYSVAVAHPVIPAQIETDLEARLRRENQLMFVPFGQSAAVALQALSDTIHAALQRAAGEDALRRELPLPSAAPDRPVLSPLEGITCPQRRLAQLISLFPAWQGTYLCLEAGNRLIILTCGHAGQAWPGQTKSASTIVGSLAAALLGQDGPLKRDGAILASYLQSLIGAVLRQAFHCESTIAAVPSSFLLPPWLAGARN